MKAFNRLVVVTVLSLASVAGFGSECETNYKSSGSMFKGKVDSTFLDFPGVEPSVVLQRMTVHLAAQGLEIVSSDESAGTIAAAAKISPTRTAPVEVRVEPLAGGTRMHFSATLPAGAIGTSKTRAIVCRMLELGRVDPASRYDHKLVQFVRMNASDQSLVSVVESSTRKRLTKVALGAIGGAILGAAHAKLTGGDVAKEAAIGAVAGGAITFAITKIQDQRLADRDDVMLAESYDPAQGYRTGVRSVSVSPETVKAGEKITIVTTYWALAPTADEKFGVHRYAGIALTGDFLRGFRFSPDPFQFAGGGGEYQTTIELEVPAATSPGTYSLHWVMDAQSAGDDASATFTVAG
jgi:outer membrane lipoprotein SlyB